MDRLELAWLKMYLDPYCRHGAGTRIVNVLLIDMPKFISSLGI